MIVAVISDTHMPRGHRRLPDACVERLKEADAILHAGDFMELEVLQAIQALGPPVHAVRGNVDSSQLITRLPLMRTVRFGASTDRDGPRRRARDRAARSLRQRFPDAHAVVFGHSHIPLHESRDGFQIFNPGSPTERRRSPHHTMGIATIQEDTVSFELITLD